MSARFRGEFTQPGGPPPKPSAIKNKRKTKAKTHGKGKSQGSAPRTKGAAADQPARARLDNGHSSGHGSAHSNGHGHRNGHGAAAGGAGKDKRHGGGLWKMVRRKGLMATGAQQAFWAARDGSRRSSSRRFRDDNDARSKIAAVDARTMLNATSKVHSP